MHDQNRIGAMVQVPWYDPHVLQPRLQGCSAMLLHAQLCNKTLLAAADMPHWLLFMPSAAAGMTCMC
jgi:hypothetical protein